MADVSNERLEELKAHAQHAYGLWAEAYQKAQMFGEPRPSERHRDWWLGYHEAIKDALSGATPWPADLGLYPVPAPGIEPG